MCWDPGYQKEALVVNGTGEGSLWVFLRRGDPGFSVTKKSSWERKLDSAQ